MYFSDEYDGWKNREVIDFFLFSFVKPFLHVIRIVKYWMTFNEINFFKKLDANWDYNNDKQSKYQAHHLFVASAKQLN